jgi:hypothetical protein
MVHALLLVASVLAGPPAKQALSTSITSSPHAQGAERSAAAARGMKIPAIIERMEFNIPIAEDQITYPLSVAKLIAQKR